MKIIAIILFSLFSLSVFQTENYYIVKVKGDIYNETAGKNLQQGDAVKATDKLVFKQKDAMAMVISDSRGRFTLKYPKEDQEYSNALLVFVKTALVTNRQNELSTRGMGISSTVSNLRNYFGNGVFNIIGDSLQIKLSTKYYPMSEGYSIVARYEQNGQFLTEKLNNQGQFILLSRKKFGIDSEKEVLLKDIGLFKINEAKEIKSQIVNTNLRFIDKTQLSSEFEVIIDKFQGDGESELQELLVNYFHDVYGKTDEILLRKYAYDLILKHKNE